MGKYIRMTKPYLVLVTAFVLVRFALELVGPEYIAWRDFELRWDSLVSEISLTRLLLVLPVFFGLRFVRESLGGWKEMVIANSTYACWGMILLILLHVVDQSLALGTHYGRGALLPTSMGTVISWVGWQLHGGPPVEPPAAIPGFCASMLLMIVITNVLCFFTILLSRKAETVQEMSQ